MLKKIKILLIVCLLGVSTTSYAQYKVGYINSTKIIQLMPSAKEADMALQGMAKNLDSQDSILAVEYQTKLAEFNAADQNGIGESIRQMKIKELLDLEQRITAFKQGAQQELIAKQEALYQPIIKLVEKAIQDVAKENGYNYVLEEASGAILFAADEKDNLFTHVKAKLGLE